MTPSNYQRTRWLTLIGTIITQFALGSGLYLEPV